ncbi:MAG: hypothetical protein ACYTKC_22075, partial [Planctomycetota bacterium]
DVYTDVCFVNANSTIFSNFKGTLSATGTATASLNVPKGLPPVPFTLYHAFIAYDPVQWHMVSNAVSVRLK